MNTLSGRNLIAGRESASGTRTISGFDPARGVVLEPEFIQATSTEIEEACIAAREAYSADRRRPPADRARLLEEIAREIEAIGEALITRVMAETALPEARVTGERGRTTAQLRMFAELVRDGSWVDVRIVEADPRRTPLPRPDIRRMLMPLGPVAVFGASNFPLAFSVAGGDTASALAAGCPVVVKAHPAHPGTSELVGRAIQRAVSTCGFHPGTFSLIHGVDPDVSLSLVQHPAIKAVGFTGSLRAGRALFDAAAARPEPIPVFAEMGSVNPVFLLKGALEKRREEIVRGLVGSMTLGAGQFCTKPGVVFAVGSPELDEALALLQAAVRETPTFTMLHGGIGEGYRRGCREVAMVPGVAMLAQSDAASGDGATATAVMHATDDDTFLAQPRLHEEVFGPLAVLVRCRDEESLLRCALALEGNLTATIHGSEEDVLRNEALLHALEERVGRLIFNGFPTGVEVCSAMQHGGPYPATTDVRFTSVGTAAIYRFARPIAYQGFPAALLPKALRA
ncbi:MAG TPA: aldehyde dehydrogenase (NADP(+)) [Rhodothermales bacterium]